MGFVLAFDHKHRKPPMSMKDLLGGKGANLAEMTSVLALPVPPGFTITTDACRAYMDAGWPGGLDDEVAKHVDKLEQAMGKRLGDPADPLLVSVRSGAKFSMPGMMDTVLNLGLNDRTVLGLAQRTRNPRFAWDCYRRFIQMFAAVVMDFEKREFEDSIEHLKRTRRVKLDTDLEARDLEQLVTRFKQAVRRRSGRAFPTAPHGPPA